nr:ROK family transcriptional regulator [uncultured Cellulosilyticum sp.]
MIERGVKGNLIKEINYKKILQLLCKGEEWTKLDLANTLKLSIPTVTTNINELKQIGIIEEVESDIYTGGRRPKIIKSIPNSRVAIGLGITKSTVTVVIMNLKNEVLIKKEKEYLTDHFIDYIKVGKSLGDECLFELGIKEEQVLGIGISIPGTINQNKQVVEHTNMGYSNIQLSDIYNLFNYSVFIDNEANLSLLAERQQGAYEEFDDLIYIGINEGLGGGIFIAGKLFKGINGRAGEFGQMQIEDFQGEELIESGNEVEDYISTKGLIDKYNTLSLKRINYFAEFERLIKEEDEVAEKVLLKAVQVLHMVIYNLNMIFDIPNFIIGGKVGRLIKEEQIFNISIFEDEMLGLSDLNIYFSDLRGTTAMGAALLPLIDLYTVG